MQRLLDQLNSRDKSVSTEALREARTLTPDQLLQLVVLAHHVRSLRRKRSELCYYTFFGIALLLIIVCPEPLFKWVSRCFILLNPGAGCIKRCYEARYSDAVIRITTLLLETDDPRFVAQMLLLNHENTNETLRAVIKRLLPQVRADHALQWSKEDKAALLLPLKRPEQDRDLTLACLRALEQAGDSSAVPAVRRLAEKNYPAGSQNVIALAARECLLYLESATGERQQAETLLRASDANTAYPEILLRPASSSPDNSTREQLLRSVE